MKAKWALVVLFASALSPSAWADEDPPDRVARLNYLSGSVSFRPANLDDWAPATRNYPLTTGDHLWTDDRARSELHIGSTVLRLGSQTALEFLNLDDRTTQVRLSQGSLNVRVRRLGEDDVVEVDTPNAAVSLLRSGTYRIDVNENGDASTITVRRGEVEVTAAGSAFPVRSQETATVSGTDAPTYDVQESGSEDSWDRWAADRDLREEREETSGESVRYVSPEVGGYEDLDGNGRWRVAADYGPIWVPSVETGWAPYRHGHWAFVAPWGWTWVDDAPWGFAPFHYGRWAYVDGSWGWCPGTLAARPVYAPALVAFVGGSNFSVSLSIGGGGGAVAWVPLGPREVYVPPYRVSPAYVQQVNVTHVTNITNITNITNNVQNVTYVNQQVPGGLTAVSQNTFVRSGGVAQAAVVVPRAAMASARVMVGGPGPQVQPQAVSVLGSASASGMQSVARPPSAALNRVVVTRIQPPPPSAPFSAQVAALAAGRPIPTTVVAAGLPHGASNRLVKSGVVVNQERASLRPARASLPAPRAVNANEVVAPSKGGPKTVVLPAVQKSGSAVEEHKAPADRPQGQGGAVHPTDEPRRGNDRPGSHTAPVETPKPPVHPADEPRRGNERPAAHENRPTPPPAEETRKPVNERPAAHENRPTPPPAEETRKPVNERPAAHENRPTPPPAEETRKPANERPAAHENRPTPKPSEEAKKPTPRPAEEGRKPANDRPPEHGKAKPSPSPSPK